MAGKMIDMSGRIIGVWEVLEFDCFKGKFAYWLCRCSCKKETLRSVRGSSLNRGLSLSCGCLRGKNGLDFVGQQRKKIKNKTYNEYILSGEYGIGYTKAGDEFYFDLEDYDRVKKYSWCLSSSGYVKTKFKTKEVRMHRLLLGVEKGEIVDHINRSRIDNRKTNLRLATTSQNSMNTSLSRDSTSGVIGVSYFKESKIWQANLQVNKRRLSKSFSKKEDAITQRLLWEKKYYGEFAPQKHLYQKYMKKDLEEIECK